MRNDVERAERERQEWASDVAARMRSAGRGLAMRPTGRREILRWMGIGAGAAVAAPLLAACGGNDETTSEASASSSTAPSSTSSGAYEAPNGEGETLTVSVWGGETERAFKEAVVPVFTELTGAEVAFDTGSGGERFNKLLAQKGAPTVDVFVNSGENVFQANRQEMLIDIDPAKVPNLEKVADWAQLFPFGLSYGLIAFGLARDEGSPALKSWGDLWRSDLQGKIALPGIGHTQMPMWLITIAEMHGGSEDDIEPAIRELVKLDPALLQFFWGEWADAAKSGEVQAATDFNYSVLGAQASGVPFEFDFPEEKAIAADNTMSIVKDRPNTELAHAFLNVTFDAEVNSKFCGEWLGSPANVDAKLPAKVEGRVPPAEEILDKVRFFDLEFIAGKRAEWTELLNTEVLPRWQ